MSARAMRVGAAVAVLAAGAAAGAVGQENPFRWGGRMAAGSTLEVRGISGSVRAELAPGAEAEVVAEKRGRAGDFDEVEIRVVREGDATVVCAVYRPDEHPDGCDMNHRDDDRPSRRRRGGRGDIRVSVDYTVRLPAGVDFVAAVVSGDVDVVGVRSDVEATSVSGDVFVSTTGTASASTVSGSLDVEMGSLEWREQDFHTVSGDITLRLPADFTGEVEFESLSGDFDSDFPVTLASRRAGRWLGQRLRGSVGDGGGRSLSFRTVSGDVRLLRAR